MSRKLLLALPLLSSATLSPGDPAPDPCSNGWTGSRNSSSTGVILKLQQNCEGGQHCGLQTAGAPPIRRSTRTETRRK